MVLITITFNNKYVDAEFKRPIFFIALESDTTSICDIYLTKKIANTPNKESVYSC